MSGVGDGSDGNAPIGTSLRDGRDHGVVRPGLSEMAGRFRSTEQAVNQHCACRCRDCD